MARDLNAPVESVEDAMEREYPPAVPKPCNDCPWRRDAIPGWLGPYDADTWLETVYGEAPIACHETIPEGGGWGPKTRQCRGAASFRRHVLKQPRNPTIEVGPEDPSIFSSDRQFKDYHIGRKRGVMAKQHPVAQEYGLTQDDLSVESYAGFSRGDKITITVDNEDEGYFEGENGEVVALERVGAPEYGNERIAILVKFPQRDPVEIPSDHME